MNKLLNNILFTNVKQSNKNFDMHFHNTYSIGITHKGLYKSKNKNNTFTFYANSTRVNNPYELHGGLSQDWFNHYFYPSIDLMSEIYFEIFDEKKIPIFEKHIIDDFTLYSKLKNVFKSIIYKQHYIVLETHCIDALAYLIKNYTSVGKDLDSNFNNNEVISKSIEFINDTLYNSPTLDELSKNIGLSKYHFIRIFKEETGLTPHQYIINKKVENARALIEKGYSIVDASLESGFNDQSHFNRNFKRIYDFSPTWINENRNFILYKN